LPTFLCVNFDQHNIDEYLSGMAALDPTNRYLIHHPQEVIVHDGIVPDSVTMRPALTTTGINGMLILVFGS
jgi:hypothetical protein